MTELQPRVISPEDRELMERHGILFVRSKDELQEYGYHLVALAIELLLEEWSGISNPDWSLLNGADVLDIGAGSYLNGDYGSPWFARVCAVNGARVVVADMLPQSEADIRLFDEVITEDIIPIVMSRNLAQLSQLQGRQFDIIHSHNLIGVNSDPELETSLKNQGITLEEFERNLAQQLRALLKERGVIYLDNLAFP